MAGDSALILVDVQRGLVAGDPPVMGSAELLARLGRLVERARGLGVPVIYVLDDDVGPLGSAEWDIHPAVAPRAGEARVRKAACDAFHETDLCATLEAVGARHLVIGGCKTEYCIDTTCRAAVTRGYPVTLVADGHSTTDSGELAAAQIIAHHNRILNGFGAYVGHRVCEIVATPAAQIAFDCAIDVPSSADVKP